MAPPNIGGGKSPPPTEKDQEEGNDAPQMIPLGIQELSGGGSKTVCGLRKLGEKKSDDEMHDECVRFYKPFDFRKPLVKNLQITLCLGWALSSSTAPWG